VPSDSSQGADISDLFSPSGDVKGSVNNATVRAILTPTLGGTTVRVHLSNRFGTGPVTFGRTTIAKEGSGAALSTTPVRLTFHGVPAVTIRAGGDVVSDAAPFSYKAFDNLAVSTFMASDAGKPTEHYTARQTSYLTANGTGDHSGDPSAGPFTQHTTTRPFVTGVDVRSASAGAVVTFGDSITDGYQGQAPAGVPETKEGIDANGRWPDVLGRRLRAAAIPLSVVNAGISGNRVLRDGADGGEMRDVYGPAAVKRLDPDVLRQSGVTTVVLLEGINDLGQDASTSADSVIAGYRQLIARMHAARLKVLQGTLTPSRGATGDYGTAATESKRQQINTWIRTQGAADGVVDFDAAVRDTSDPSRINPAYDGGDHLHFNLAGYKKMGEAVDLMKLRRPPRCAPKLSVAVTPRRVVAGRLTTFTIRVRAGGKPVHVARVELGGHRGVTRGSGVARLRVRLRRPGVHTLVVSASAARTARVPIRVLPRRRSAGED
jgi:lysophospholipase L1-like esterase